MYQDLELDRPLGREADRKVSYGQAINMASLNVCSIAKATMHLQIEAYMQARGVSLLCLQETKLARTTQYVVGDMLYAMHGHGEEGVEHAGVGMVFDSQIRRHVTGVHRGAER